MHYQFVFADWFNRNLKALGKRNPKLREDLESFLQTFEPERHPLIPGTGGARKARMRLTGRGKRGGYRVVYYFVGDSAVWLITIYDKVRQETLTPDETARVAGLIQDIRARG